MNKYDTRKWMCDTHSKQADDNQLLLKSIDRKSVV